MHNWTRVFGQGICGLLAGAAPGFAVIWAADLVHRTILHLTPGYLAALGIVVMIAVAAACRKSWRAGWRAFALCLVVGTLLGIWAGLIASIAAGIGRGDVM